MVFIAFSLWPSAFEWPYCMPAGQVMKGAGTDVSLIRNIWMILCLIRANQVVRGVPSEVSASVRGSACQMMVRLRPAALA